MPISTVYFEKEDNYGIYNNLAHIQEKGWKFLIRIKDGTGGIASGLTLPDADEFDVPFLLKLTNKQSNEVKQLLKDKNHYKAITNGVRFDYLPRKSRKHDLPSSMTFLSESFVSPSPKQLVKPLLQIWMNPLFLYRISRNFMRCAGALKLLSAV